MASLSPCSVSSSDVFENGSYKTVLREVEGEKCGREMTVLPPRPLLISMPCGEDEDEEDREFPVVLFSHGYLLYNSFYSQLIQHVASHGFIVIAPQLYTVAGPDAREETNLTAQVANWLPKGLHPLLPPHVKPDLTHVALSGHSRGAKTAFALALNRTQCPPILKFSALIAIDPVDGTAKGKQTPPQILSYAPESLDLGLPVMVVGSGLGELPRNALFPPCAPKGVNHVEFFSECRGPAWHFVVEGYGHLDVLDDETSGFRGRATHCLCASGDAREPMRRFVGGAVVAFLRAYWAADWAALVAIRDKTEGLPVQLSTLEFRS